MSLGALRYMVRKMTKPVRDEITELCNSELPDDTGIEVRADVVSVLR